MQRTSSVKLIPTPGNQSGMLSIRAVSSTTWKISSTPKVIRPWKRRDILLCTTLHGLFQRHPIYRSRRWTSCRRTTCEYLERSGKTIRISFTYTPEALSGAGRTLTFKFRPYFLFVRFRNISIFVEAGSGCLHISRGMSCSVSAGAAVSMIPIGAAIL